MVTGFGLLALFRIGFAAGCDTMAPPRRKRRSDDWAAPWFALCTERGHRPLLSIIPSSSGAALAKTALFDRVVGAQPAPGAKPNQRTNVTARRSHRVTSGGEADSK